LGHIAPSARSAALAKAQRERHKPHVSIAMIDQVGHGKATLTELRSPNQLMNGVSSSLLWPCLRCGTMLPAKGVVEKNSGCWRFACESMQLLGQSDKTLTRRHRTTNWSSYNAVLRKRRFPADVGGQGEGLACAV